MPPFQSEKPDNKSSQNVQNVHEKIELQDLHPFYKFAYNDAQDGFKERIDMRSFNNRKDLPKDLAKVEEKLAQVRATILRGTEEERMAYVQSDIFEHMLYKHIGEAHWFGETMKSILPSVYDDLFNGIDLILEQNVGQGAFAFSTLAIDATFSATGAVKKLEHARDLLSKGRLGTIKYFKSVQADITGRIDNVPHFVIGMGRPALFKMTSEYVQKGPQPGINQEARRMVIEQITVQAKYYADFLRMKGFGAEAEKYMRVERDMGLLLSKIELTHQKSKESDEVHNAIIGYCTKRD